ncbi:hypothetical protein BIV24_18145 [Streptomyces colonosanans]|uniref:Sugar ABC transporter substrate-binding protein n=1 Tax=Streptomyces colonosanans TaxID=1428652 RepID=A0A1S2P988_9ACTN|nr:hypothetical protein BIV24_18145 [Streptomyces colonosanans]
MPEVSRKTALAATFSVALLATACTGQSSSGANDDASKETTITFRHAWSAPSETKAVNALIAGFEKAHPNIHVNVVANMTDDKMNQALRTGGDKAPDVISYGLESSKGAHHTDRNLTMAATVLVMAPVILVFFFAQKAFVEGVTLTGVKG